MSVLPRCTPHALAPPGSEAPDLHCCACMGRCVSAFTAAAAAASARDYLSHRERQRALSIVCRCKVLSAVPLLQYSAGDG